MKLLRNRKLNSPYEKKPSILFVTPSRLAPASSGGHWRSLNVAQSLANSGYPVTILSLAGRRRDYRLWKGAKFSDHKISDNLREITDLRLRQGMAQFVFNKIGYSKLWSFSLWPFFGPSPIVTSLLASQDIFIFDSPFIKRPFLSRDKLSILLSHNLETEILQRGNFWQRFIWLPIVGRIESSQRYKFQAVLTCAKSDTDFYKRGPALVSELPNGMSRLDYSEEESLEARRDLGIEESSLMVLFVGSDYQPNVDALHDIKAFVNRQRRQLEKHNIVIFAVGSVGKADDTDPLIKVTGRVPDMRIYLKAANLSLNPVTWGSGSNVKVFESLAAAVPVLSTPFGLRGIDDSIAKKLMVFKDDDELLSQLMRAVDEKKRLRDLGMQVLEDHKEHILMDDMVQNKVLPILEATYPTKPD